MPEQLIAVRPGVLFPLLLANSLAAGAPRVTLDGETLVGKWSDSPRVAEFLGVPFAAPPVGGLRWRAPQPYRAKPGRRAADEFAPACMQTQRLVDWYRELAALSGATRDVVPDLPVSEDCLYLNVWTPAPRAGAARPVLVYVHGGSNVSGWSFEPNYRGRRLAAQGAVVVSIAYRLGDFGFFAHPELADGPALANFGLWDQVAALEWLRRHIARFGGDPGRITLFGESAGAEDIVALLRVRRADHLFQRAILQSTAGFGLENAATLAEERKRGVRLAAALGGGEALSIEAMRRLAAREILEASVESGGGYYHSPVVDGVLLENTLAESLREARYPDRPLIVGTNADEWYADVPADANRETLERTARELFGDGAERALAAVAGEPDARQAIDTLTTARRMLCPSRYFALAYPAAGGGAVRMYRFSRVREGAVGDAWGAYHGTELPYVFDTHDAWIKTTGIDRRITGDVVAHWLRFASHGTPDRPGEPAWPVFAAPGYLVRAFGDEEETVPATDRSLCRLYDDSLSH